MQTYTNVAHIIGLHGIHGRLIARACDGLPFLLEPGMTVHFVPPALRAVRTAVVKTIDLAKAGDYFVTFEGIDSRESTEILVGRYCLVSDADLPAVVRDDFSHMLDYNVLDEAHGLLGKLVRIDTLPGQMLLVVASSLEDTTPEILIPAVDEIVHDIDDVNRIVHVCIPDGLLSL